MTRDRKCLAVFATTLPLLIQSVAASEPLVINGVKEGVLELDLFNPQSGAYVRSVSADSLEYPIDILDDQQGMFVIEVGEEHYSVGSSFIRTSKVYAVSAECRNAIENSTVASSRGVAGKGCAQ